MEQIERGWPETIDEVPNCLRPFFTFADELSISCGLVFKGHRIVVPHPVRQYFLDRLHSVHIGINGCLRRARETVYWPGITTAIKRTVGACEICARHQQSHCKEPLLPYTPPERPWSRVGVDIFEFNNHPYLCTVDYLTGFFEVDKLPSKAVTNIVYCLRQHFARHGLPLEVVSDNSPFASAEFRHFAQQYDFTHITSSPRYPASNGRVENAIKTVKRLMIKARESNSDPLLALLEWRNTPSEQLDSMSPAELLFGRRTRTLLPVADKLLDTPSSRDANIPLHKAKDRQSHNYNRTAKQRPPLSVGQTVRVKYDERPQWRKAEIDQVLPHRSYVVKFDDGTTRRRTSKHVRFSAESPIIIADDTDAQDAINFPAVVLPNVPPSSVVPPRGASRATHNKNVQSSAVPVVTRSGRVVRRPARYDN